MKSDKERIDELERRIAELERLAPFWSGDHIKWPVDQNGEWHCTICGIDQKSAMFYVCTNDKCPGRVSYTCKT